MHVVCIDDNRLDRYDKWGINHPVRGTVYTVRGTCIAWAGSHQGEQHIHVEELVNTPCQCKEGFGEPWWLHSRFRPLADSRLDVFRSLLTDVPHDDNAEVVS